MTKMYEEVKTLIEHEIAEILKKDDITPADLDALYKEIDILKDICEVDSMDSPKGSSYGVMPYWGSIQYEDRPNTNRSSYGRMSRYNDNSSYGRYDGYDNRMMPREW